MACENFWSLALGQPQWGNLSLRNTSLIGQPPRKYIFCFSPLSPPPIPSPTLEVKVTKFQLPLNRKVWHTWFVNAFFPLYSFVVSFIISFYLLLSSMEVWEDCSCLEIEKNSNTFWGSVKIQILLMTCWWCHMTKQSRSKTFKGRSVGKILTLIFRSKFDLFLILFHHAVLQQYSSTILLYIENSSSLYAKSIITN